MEKTLEDYELLMWVLTSAAIVVVVGIWAVVWWVTGSSGDARECDDEML